MLFAFKGYSEKVVGFSDGDTSDNSSAVRFIVGANATPEMVEQYIANAVQATFFSLIELRKLVKVQYLARALLIEQAFPSELTKYKKVIMHIGQSYLNTGVKNEKIIFLLVEMFVRAYSQVFAKSTLFELN
jgi:hypothetical protein